MVRRSFKPGWWLAGGAGILLIVAAGVYAMMVVRTRALISDIDRHGRVLRGDSEAPAWLRKQLPGFYYPFLDRVTLVELGGCELDEPQLARLLIRLQEFEHLEGLRLNGTRLTDESLQPIGRMAELQSLDVSNTSVGDRGLAHLRGLAQLRDLALARTGVTDSGLRHLAGLPRLELLVLDGTAVTDEGMNELVSLKHLSTLHVSNTAVTEDGLSGLRRTLPELEAFDD